MGNAPGSPSCVDSDDEDDDFVNTGSMHTNMMRFMNDDVFQKYKVVEVLGTGSMGFVAKAKVRSKQFKSQKIVRGLMKKLSSRSFDSQDFEEDPDRGKRRDEKPYFALKSIRMERVSLDFINELRNEMDILRRLDHPNIVRAYEVFYNKRQIYMVLELCEGGNLFRRAPYSEKEAAAVTGKLLSAIKYMHDHGIVHRDLKFENILWENDSPNAEIKVIDFGLSKKFGQGEKDIMHEGVGTIYTMAPQVLQGVYTSQADLWSLGVIVYMLLSTIRPFPGKRRIEVIGKIMRADYVLEGIYWDDISPEAKDMVSHLLEPDPHERLTATSALKHVWLSKKFNPSDRKPNETICKKVKTSLMTYHNSSELKKIALNVIAHRSTSKEIMELRKCFDHYDSSNDGIIELHEFKAAMKAARYTDEDIAKMFGSIDVDQNGYIQYTEFLAATLETHQMIEEDRILEAFEQLDSDNSGLISKENLVKFLGRDASVEEIEHLMAQWDIDNDGQISHQEFTEMFRSSTNAMKKQIFDPLEKDKEAGMGLDADITGGEHDSGS